MHADHNSGAVGELADAPDPNGPHARGPRLMRLGRSRPPPVPRKLVYPNIEIHQILAWADAFYARLGEWPTRKGGVIPEDPTLTWAKVDAALGMGMRGLTGGSSMARLLAAERGKRNRKALPPFTEARILEWADAYYARHGTWPNRHAGPIIEAPGETWTAVDVALANGLRGFPRGSSLARLLQRERNMRSRANQTDLSVSEILAWADEHHARTGAWPHIDSGTVHAAPRETWGAIQSALTNGRRGVSGGSSLLRLLAEERGARMRMAPPSLTIEQILHWARDHHNRTGKWPKQHSGRLFDAPDESWAMIDRALTAGMRGLPGGTSLASLLLQNEGVRTHLKDLPPYTVREILSWADSHHARTGKWPGRHSGMIEGAPGVTWNAVDLALARGMRGLPGGTSLVQLLEQERGHVSLANAPRLYVPGLLAWADAHYERAGTWPNTNSGRILEAPAETWRNIDKALRNGLRGVPAGASLAAILFRERGARSRAFLPELTIKLIRQWAADHHRRTGKWPRRSSGVVLAAPGETWAVVEHALKHGLRGLPGGMTLARLLHQTDGVRMHAKDLPPFSERQIENWARAYQAHHGEWPHVRSGSIPQAPVENWSKVDSALRIGLRGLPGRSSLHRLLSRIGSQGKAGIQPPQVN